eukprot:1681818-Amphidinium_carterae.1
MLQLNRPRNLVKRVNGSCEPFDSGFKKDMTARACYQYAVSEEGFFQASKHSWEEVEQNTTILFPCAMVVVFDLGCVLKNTNQSQVLTKSLILAQVLELS